MFQPHSEVFLRANVKRDARTKSPASTLNEVETCRSIADIVQEIPPEFLGGGLPLQYPTIRRRKSDSDEEYLPLVRLKKKKKKKESNVKPTYRGKSKKEENMIYSEDVTKHIEIITISEEERKREKGEMLNLRKSFQFLCEWCALGFVLEEAYNMHMKVHSPEAGDFECELCSARVKTKTMLYRHRLRHYRRYRCAVCLMVHKDKDTAASHVMTEHARQAFVCVDCSRSFNKTRLYRHRLRHYRRYRCAVCLMVHKDKDTAVSHVMTEHARQAFVCVDCSRSFKRPRYLERHIEQHHTKLLNFACPDCNRVFHEKGRYRSHVRSHKEEIRNRSTSVVVCAICAKAYKSKSCLKRHLQTHLATVCILCCISFDHQEALRLHYAHVHNSYYDGMQLGEKCPHCPLVCGNTSLLNKHIKRMHKDRTKKYQCDYCQRLYLTKGEVRSHILWSHERRGGHACAAPGCARVFRSPARLRQHTKVDHLGLPPPRDHECPTCGKGFINKQVLQRHLRVHSDEKYPCKECGMMFKTEPYVRVHYQLKHLNMTRAQIKEAIKLRKAQSINLFKPTVKEIKKAKRTPSLDLCQPQDKADSFIPMFETFVDVQRDILNAGEVKVKEEPVDVGEC